MNLSPPPRWKLPGNRVASAKRQHQPPASSGVPTKVTCIPKIPVACHLRNLTSEFLDDTKKKLACDSETE
jgi:hypothetical protein